MICRGIRGATTVSTNRPTEIIEATTELLRAIAAANELVPSDVASAIFTTTRDLDAAFPAQAARLMGWTEVPLMDAMEIPVPGDLERCIRVLIHWNTSQPPEAVRHVYLRDAASLRPDRANGSRHPANGSLRQPLAAVGADDLAVPIPVGLTPPLVTAAGRQHSKGIVAYQGEPGAYSQEAIYQHFGSMIGTLPFQSFEEIFTAVESGKATLGLLPVENSQAGSINQAYDLLLDHDLRVAGEVKLRVRHCLLAPKGSSAAEITQVRSHPQALAQCERYLKTHGWEAIPAYDTAGAAKELAEKLEPHTAAIASALAGQTYGLDILDSGIEDSPYNTTRFFLLGREEVPPGAQNKTSIVFSTTHTPGALYNTLGELASRGINLTKIESRPRRNRPWHYVFYVDMEGHWQDAGVHRALSSLLARCAFVKLLGSYPAAPETPAV